MVKNGPITLKAVLITIMLSSCDHKTVDPKKFNEIIAQIVDVTSGQTLDFKATGSNTMMECDIYHISTYISGTDPDNGNANIEISVPLECVTTEGNFGIQGSYDRNKIGEAYEPDFTSKGSGSITFTKVDGQHIEGNFNIVLYCVFPYNNCDEKDSVIVSGSFKGDGRP
jgi:hypothetical protein